MRVAVLLSGGVDSSVALALLKSQGYEVVAFYLKIWLEDEVAFLGNCPWDEDLKWVRAVCEKLGVEFHAISLQKEYWNEVVSYAISELQAGRTPNPDMLCNQKIKFGKFYERLSVWCRENSVDQFDKVASGHYAKVEEQDGVFYLKMAPDPVKDQTYFLAHLNQEQLSKALFPISEYSKDEVRQLAKKFDLPNQDRKDSQGVCFLGKIKFREFIKFNLGEKKGDFVEFETGKKVGEHNGFWFYTLGQRRDLRVDNGPWFVVKKDAEKNVVYISRSYFEEDKLRDTFRVAEMNWISGVPVNFDDLQVKIRHGEHLYRAQLSDFSADKKSFAVKIDQQDQGLAPGQFGVFYENGVCLGGGKIV
jgi:tRNA-specific 2-thiouridylase